MWVGVLVLSALFRLALTDGLPSVAPTSYEVTMSIKKEDNTFSGHVTVYFNVLKEDLDQLRVDLDSKIDFSDVQVAGEDEKLIDAKEVLRDSTDPHQLLVTPASRLQAAGHYKLSVNFKGSLNTAGDVPGPFAVKDQQGVWWYGVSPGSCASSFPCWAATSLRARFQLLVQNCGEADTVLANAQLDRRKKNTGNQGFDHQFGITAPMSASEFQFIASEGINKANSIQKRSKSSQVSLNVWGDSTHLESASNSLLAALEHTASWTGVAYSQDKLDVVESAASPAGGSTWGLAVASRGTLSLSSEPSCESEELVAVRSAMTVLEQWFGGEVAPASGSDSWLTDALQFHLGYIIADKMEPSWGMRARQSSAQRQAMLADAAGTLPALNAAGGGGRGTSSHHAVKGAALLRMLESAASLDTLQEAVKQFTAEGQMSAATASSLWTALQRLSGDASGVRFDAVVGTWLDQPGLPLLSLKQSDSGAFQVTQERFRLQAVVGESTTAEWTVPVRWVGGSKTTWLSPTGASLDSKDAQEGFLALDSDSGYYVVNYDESHWAQLFAVLHSDKRSSVPPRVIAQLLWDTQWLARAGRLGYSTAMNFLLPLLHEPSLEAWEAAAAHINFLHAQLFATPVYKTFKDFTATLVDWTFGWTRWTVDSADSHERRLLRRLVGALACKVGNAACISEVTQLLQGQLSGTARIHEDVLEEVLCWGVYHSETNWDKVFAGSSIPQDQALQGLVCSEDSKRQSRLLEHALSSTEVTQSTFERVLLAAAAFPAAFETVLDFVSKHYDDIVKKAGSQVVPALTLATLATVPTTSDALKKVQTVVDNHRTSLGTAVQIVDRALTEATQRVAWSDRYYKQVESWLESGHSTPAVRPDYPTTTPTTTTPVPTTEKPTHPTQPDVKPTHPDVKPTQPHVKPTQPDVKPTQPHVKPTQPDVKPTQPHVKPTQPDVKPTQPDVKPTQPDVEPTQPDVKPTQPDVKPTQPDVNPTQPDVKPTQPDVKPTQPDVKPTQPDVKPTHPDVKPTQPDVKPTQPDVKPTQPDVKPTQPDVKPTQPHVKPTQPDVKPTQPPATAAPPHHSAGCISSLNQTLFAATALLILGYLM